MNPAGGISPRRSTITTDPNVYYRSPFLDASFRKFPRRKFFTKFALMINRKNRSPVIYFLMHARVDFEGKTLLSEHVSGKTGR